MKTSDHRTTTQSRSQQPDQQPFFRKDGDGFLFSEAQPDIQPFFTPKGPLIQKAEGEEGGAPGVLPEVDQKDIPEIWQEQPVPPSGGADVIVYRGFRRRANQRMNQVLRASSDVGGGTLTLDEAAAQDAVFNKVEPPVLEGEEIGGVVQITIPPAVWDLLVQTRSISIRNYYGFGRNLSSSELRVNSVEALNLINSQAKSVLPPDRSKL
ncbi:MAG: hypothetical protein H6557_34375 [Lewinellaceae bacterium]|nr:hypothetical protein [Phaeodactylibacter sp.]MCB9041729.1 hypothetical protein [Lewinellaceae bacterium]